MGASERPVTLRLVATNTSVGTSTISNISNTSTRSPTAKSIITRDATTLAVRTATGAVSVSSTTGPTDSVTIREMKKKLKNKYCSSTCVNTKGNQYIVCTLHN